MTSFPYVPVYHTGPKVHIFCVPNKINLHQNWIQYVKRDDFISSKNSIASKTSILNRPIKQEVLSDDEIEKENELVKVPCNKERETCRVHKKNSRRGRKYRKVIKKEVVEEHDEVLQKSCSVNATENKKENCTTFHEISNIDFSSDLLHQESSSSKVLNDQDEKKVNNYVNDNKNSYSFITDNGKVSSENSGEVDNNLSYFDDYMILSGPIPEYDPTYKRPNKHWEDMCKVAENLGINVEAVLRRAEEERKNRSACATFKFTRPTLKLLSMQFETDKKTVFLKRGSNHVFMRRPSYKRFYYYK